MTGERRNTIASDGEVGGYIASVITDNVGNPWRTTDATGLAVDMRYDLLGRNTSVTTKGIDNVSVNQAIVSYLSTPIGWQTTVTDAAGRSTISRSNYLGQTYRTELPPDTVGGPRPSFVTGFYADGSVSGSLDALGNASSVQYDARGRTTGTLASRATAGATRASTGYVYSLDSLLQSVTDPLGRVSTFSYDVGGRLSQSTAPDPDGAGPLIAARTTLTRDALGNVLASQDALNQVDRVVLDARLRPTASIDAAGFTTQTAYDVYSRVTSVTDAKNNVTTFGNDRLGRSFRETKGTDSRTKTLDAAGNARQLTDRNGRVTTYEYDTLQRPTREAWKNGSKQEIRELVYG